MSGVLPFCEDGEATLHAFKDNDLGYALGWKYNNVSGIRTFNGQIILSEDMGLHGWPSSLGEIPSETELKEICDNYRADFSSLAYARSRKAEYPPLEDQLDHIYHNGVASWKANMVKPVKDKYPQP